MRIVLEDCMAKAEAAKDPAVQAILKEWPDAKVEVPPVTLKPDGTAEVVFKPEVEHG